MPNAVRVVTRLKDQDDVVPLLIAGNDGKALVWDYGTGAFEMAPHDGVYVASVFRWTDGSYSELVLLSSLDGKTWNTLAPIKFYTTPADRFKDPCIMLHDGVYWVCHSGHDPAATPTFGVIKSVNLRDWSAVATPDLSSISGIGHAYAPEWFVDDDGSVHIFLACNNGHPSADFKVYELHPTNAGMTTWSTPVEVTGTSFPTSIIDPHVTRIGATYYLWYKDNIEEVIELASSSSLTSGYTLVHTGNWAGWGTKKEAVYPIQLPDGTWRVYGQDYNTIPGEYLWYSDSADDWATWSAATPITTPWRVMHGAVIHLVDPASITRVLAIHMRYSATGPSSAPTGGNFVAFDGTDGRMLKDSTSKASDFATAGHTHGVTSVDLGAHVYNDANQNVSNTTWTALSFNSERYDTDTIHDNSTNNSRLTCKTAGKYLIHGQIIWDTNQTGTRYISIYLNGTTEIALRQVRANSSAQLGQEITTIYNLSVNDYVELRVYQDSGGTRTVNVYSVYSPEFMMQKVG